MQRRVESVEIPELKRIQLRNIANLSVLKDSVLSLFQQDTDLVTDCTNLEYLFANPSSGFLTAVMQKMQRSNTKICSKNYIFPYLVWIASFNKASALNPHLIKLIHANNGSSHNASWRKNALILAIAVAFNAREFIKQAFKSNLFNCTEIDSVILLAGKEHDIDKMRFLIDEAIAYKLINLDVKRDEYFLFLAIKQGDFKLLDYLLENGFDVNSKNAKGMSCLFAAVHECTNRKEIISVLLKHDADTRFKYKNLTPQDYAHFRLKHFKDIKNRLLQIEDNRGIEDGFKLIEKKDPQSLNFKHSDIEKEGTRISLEGLPLAKILKVLVDNVSQNDFFSEMEAEQIIVDAIATQKPIMRQINGVHIDMDACYFYPQRYDANNFTYYRSSVKTAFQCITAFKKLYSTERIQAANYLTTLLQNLFGNKNWTVDLVESDLTICKVNYTCHPWHENRLNFWNDISVFKHNFAENADNFRFTVTSSDNLGFVANQPSITINLSIEQIIDRLEKKLAADVDRMEIDGP